MKPKKVKITETKVKTGLLKDFLLWLIIQFSIFSLAGIIMLSALDVPVTETKDLILFINALVFSLFEAGVLALMTAEEEVVKTSRIVEMEDVK